MSAKDTVTFYLHPKLRKQAERGNHNFINLVSVVLADAGLQVAFDDDDDLARIRALARPGRSFWLMDDPVNARSLTFRKTYLYPFWHIEKQAARWDWPVAQDRFDASAVPAAKAVNFNRFWSERLFGDAPKQARRDGFVFVPLQGRLLQKRSFQSCSPIEMVKAVLAHDPQRQVAVTLHPKEAYPREEQQALERLLEKHSRLAVGVGNMERNLQRCDYVVTQNSGAGFMGYFFEKPLILFGRADFHHIALNVDKVGTEAAFAAVEDHAPDYAAYLYWFLQMRAINAGRPEVKKKIRTVLRGHGWPV